MSNLQSSAGTGSLTNQLKECPQCGKCYDRNDRFCQLDGGSLVFAIQVERLLAGRYLLECRIGKGGMGAVYQALDLAQNINVAIKILHLHGDNEAVQRFEREAKTTMNLNHPNIISVYDYGSLGRIGAYLVMELAEGHTLREHLDTVGQLPPELAARWFNDLCEGLKSAHELSIIHRDLKPENVFVIKQGEREITKIFDFGLAKSIQDGIASTNITSPGTVLGTLGYMPPEQLMGEPADERSDIFALGVIAAEAVTGQRPFDGLTIMQLMASTLKDVVQLDGNTPEALRLNAVLQKAMAKNRSERYSSVAELQTELIPAIRDYKKN